MKKNNILILSAGRRVELVQDFKTEAAKFSDGIKVFAADMQPNMSAACHVSDKAFLLPAIQADDYIDHIFDLSIAHNIGLIIPTIDTELQKLADARLRFEAEGIHIIVSDAALIRMCRDKRQTVDLFNQYGIQSPAIYNRNDLTMPCFVKPYDGSRALGAKRILSQADISIEMMNDPKLMFCQLIDIVDEFQEFTVDMYYDRKGHLKCAIPRERLEVRTGEISKGITRQNHLYQALVKQMANLTGARGCITAQFFYQEKTQTFYGVEINPRFGGGFPLTYAAGGNYLNWLIQEYIDGADVPFFDAWENHLMMLRYDAKVLVHEHHLS